MKHLAANTQPLFMQLLREIEDKIMTGEYKANEIIPSSVAFAQKYAITASTVQRGIHLLVKRGLLFKKRGIGFYVCNGAYQTINSERRSRFNQDYIKAMVSEAEKLGLSIDDVLTLIDNSTQQRD